MSVPLSAMPATFNLQIEEKKFFPHLYNKRENLSVLLPHLPPKEDYIYNSMKPSARIEFIRWYDQHQNDEFHLAEKLAEYCSGDVKILLHATVEMQRLFREITDLDILDSITIASACMKHFRTSHLEAEQLPIIPEMGYEAKTNQSTLARKFLKWYAQKHKVNVRDCDSDGGEKPYRKYMLDGFVSRSQEGLQDAVKRRDLAIEVHGSVFIIVLLKY